VSAILPANFILAVKQRKSKEVVCPFRVGLSFVKEEIPSLTYILAAPRGRGRIWGRERGGGLRGFF